MGHPSLTLCLALMSLLTLGCQPSVELPDEPSKPAASSESTTAGETETPMERVKADKPVNQDPGAGYLGGVASGYRHAREQIEDLPVKQAIQFFWASEGRYPKSHEEFMEKVIRANQMQLPAIEEGYRYEYNPEDHVLWKVPIEEESAPQE